MKENLNKNAMWGIAYYIQSILCVDRWSAVPKWMSE